MGPAYYVRSRSSAASSRRPDLAERPDLPRQPAPLRQPSQPGLHGPDGHRHADVRLPPLDRPEGRARRGERPRRRRPHAGRGRATCRRSSRRCPGTGVEFDAPDLSSPPTAGATTNLTFHLSSSDASSVLPAGHAWSASAGTRSTPVDHGRPGATRRSPRRRITVARASPRRRPTRRRARRPTSTRSRSLTPEVPGEVVAPVRGDRRGRPGRPSPSASRRRPGLYRLVGDDPRQGRRRLRRRDPGADARAHRPRDGPADRGLRRPGDRVRDRRRPGSASTSASRTSARRRGARRASATGIGGAESRARQARHARRPLGQPRRRRRRARRRPEATALLPAGLAPGTAAAVDVPADRPEGRRRLPPVRRRDHAEVRVAGRRRRAAGDRPGHRVRRRARRLRDPRRARDRGRALGVRGLRPADPDRGPARWQPAIVEAALESPPPLDAGSRIRIVADVAGQRTTSRRHGHGVRAPERIAARRDGRLADSRATSRSAPTSAQRSAGSSIVDDDPASAGCCGSSRAWPARGSRPRRRPWRRRSRRWLETIDRAGPRSMPPAPRRRRATAARRDRARLPA